MIPNHNKTILKQNVKNLRHELCGFFNYKESISKLTQRLVRGIDSIILSLFTTHQLDLNNSFCLLAIGGYGRCELQLFSDIDLLILHQKDISPDLLNQAQGFIQDCWDIGLEVSHQLTTAEECAELASHDLSVISSIMDMRFISGDKLLMDALIYFTHPLNMWTSHDYFFAKQNEQTQRYIKYGETAYNLEPNVKNGAGGLRDLHILSAISKRHFGITTLEEGIPCGFISEKEYQEFLYCQHFLWQVRFALHLIAQKKEDRLLFDYQVKLARLFNYKDTANSLAIEQFMKAYFNVIKRSRELNEVLLQWFSEVIIHKQKKNITPINDHFQLSNNYIEVRHANVFSQKPTALLELFLWIAKNPNIIGVRANTIRLIRNHLHLINKRYRLCKTNTQLFIAILNTNNDPFKALQRMSRYGVLGHYLDCFAAVTGQMQYDLFHVFTVDQHTLFVIRNLGRFLNPDYQQAFPLCCKLMLMITKRDTLYLSALFHDIAKGRGGDHSTLGAIEAKQFAVRHHLEIEDQELLIWLVEHHLLMSQTAQRQDIYDPKTIHDFCHLLPNRYYLDYLYLLTVADICATNPTLWNAWKDSLLKELYYAAAQTMEHEKTMIDEHARISLRKEQALQLLMTERFSAETINELWSTFKDKYFLHESPESIARHTQAILTCCQFPLVVIMPHHSQGGTEVFIYMPHRDERFSITTTVLSNHHATIQEATILTCDNNFDLDTYIILDETQQTLLDERRADALKQVLSASLANTTKIPAITKRRLSRTQAHFKTKTSINYSTDKENQFTQLFLITGDKPGLLAHISRIFFEEKIHLSNAKIATVGERVEDMFFISTKDGFALNKEAQDALCKKLVHKLEAGETNY